MASDSTSPHMPECDGIEDMSYPCIYICCPEISCASYQLDRATPMYCRNAAECTELAGPNPSRRDMCIGYNINLLARFMIVSASMKCLNSWICNFENRAHRVLIPVSLSRPYRISDTLTLRGKEVLLMPLSKFSGERKGKARQVIMR